MKEKYTSSLFKLLLFQDFVTAAEPLSYLIQRGFVGLLAIPKKLMLQNGISKNGKAREQT